ncbi:MULTISPECIES: trypsin-like serine protease [unclassified Nocardioides]|uniref:trypsin-like serine protease n=1 Tax=unclassified Nocardioides TaxID=2615069 RepID=UPI0006F42F34|nr:MULTISPECIES: trypsin-like serine protease [unclassified Nocardioides]KRA38165.1 pterin-4-alpha-carbinolamine dehydratase [Nocardioides sp. Root614]KRA92125.1 pterin-4-alpha-carbinolamine dehydratase [Nocardioides sp. Root682]
MRARLLTLAAATIVGLGFLAPATASTGGTADGENHPNVGMIAFYDAEGRFRCSATLVSPTVLVTAAHCTDGTLGKTLVTFDSVVAEAPPSPLPVAADLTAGYTAEELAAAGYLSGTAHTHPDYSDFTDMDNWNDVGVIVLDEPVTDITPAPIAGLHAADAIKQPRKTLFTAVGYGTEVRQADSGSQKPTPMSYPIIRRFVDMPGQKITPQIIQTNGNEKDIFGTGGTCFGDSGGSLWLNGAVVAVTSYGYTSNCRYIDGYQRIDIPVVADWLAEFGL